MKKILTVIAAVMMLLSVSGCTKKMTDAERFAEEFKVTESNSISYLKQSDVIYQLTHGTHLVLFASPKGSVPGSEELKRLIEAVSSHSGIIVFYYNTDDLSGKLKDEVLTALAPEGTEVTDMTVVFVKQGEVVRVVYDGKSVSDKPDYDSFISEIEQNIQPGCNDC